MTPDIIQTFSWKGIDWNSALKITDRNTNLISGQTTLFVNRYTDATMQYDIEQFVVYTDSDDRIAAVLEHLGGDAAVAPEEE